MAELQTKVQSGIPTGSASSVGGPNTAKLAPKEPTPARDAAKRKMKADMKSKLKSWTAASSTSELDAGETKREYKFSCPPDWKCIICEEAIYRNAVYQCQTGHLACSWCSQEGESCRSCSKAVSRIKNTAVEKMMESLEVTCKYAKLGCKEVTKFKDSENSKHEKNCPFMPMDCPMPGCKQAGVKNLLAQHLLAEHKISCLVDVGKLLYEHPMCKEYSKESKEFDVDSSTTLVMLRHMPSQDFHLLHHQSTALGDRLQITSLAKARKRKYELDVKISEEQTYCHKSVSASNIQSGWSSRNRQMVTL